MKVSKLIEVLTQLSDPYGNLEIEIATGPYKDDWYKVYNVEIDYDYRGDRVIVINTD